MCCADNMPPRVPFSQHYWLTFSLLSTISTDWVFSVVVRKLLLSQPFPTLCLCRWQFLINTLPEESCHQLPRETQELLCRPRKPRVTQILKESGFSTLGEALRSSVSKDAIPTEQRDDPVQAPCSHDRVGKNTATEFTTVKWNMESIPILGNFI